jgi:hypothetical protein
MFVPLAVAAGLRMLAAPGLRTGLWFGAAVAAQWLSSMYIGVMLMSFLVPFMLLAAVAWRVRPARAVVTASAAAAGVLLPALLALGVPYMQSREDRGERGPQEVSDGSAAPSDYAATHMRLASYAWHSRVGNHPERELYPGTTTLALAAVGLVPPLSAGATATLVAGALTFDWSLGFKGLTYGELYKRSVVHRGMRVPARFSVVVGAALALLGAFGARRAIRFGPGARAQASICAALAVLVLVDLRLDPQVQPYFRTIPSIYAHVTSDMVLAELPRSHDVDYMYFSTRHWARLLGGYSGFIPGDERLEAALREFPSPSAIARFRALGATHVTYNCRFEENTCEMVLGALDANPDLRLVADEHWGSGPVRLYQIVPAQR